MALRRSPAAACADRRTLLALGALGLACPIALRAQTPTPRRIRFRLAEGRMWLDATIDGSRPLSFVVDTGAPVHFLRPDVARALGLAPVAAGWIGGVGKEQAVSGLVLARELVIDGGFREAEAEFRLYDFAGGLPPRAAGLIAAGPFTAFDSDVDFERGEWRLWPAGRPDRAGLLPMISDFEDPPGPHLASRMLARLRLDGRAYRVMLDTGAAPGLLLFATAAARTGLFRDRVPFAPQPIGGFGGLAARPGRIVRAARLELGPLAIERPLVTLGDPALADPGDLDGIVGLPFLRLLTLGTDVRRRRLLAARNGIAPPVEGYPLAGIAVDREGVVVAVGTGSPAAAAGLVRGDRIVALVRGNGGAGTSVTLRVQRAEGTHELRYTLAPWL